MIRKLLLSTAAVALLGGCMTSGYGYRQDRGDYYYGQPATEYRYYGSPYGYPGYGYPGAYSRYPYGSAYYGGYYGAPYYNPYHNPYPRRPYHPRPPRPPVVVGPGNPPPVRPPADDRGDDRRPPWRNFNPRGRQDQPPGAGQVAPTRAVAPMPPPARDPAPRVRGDGGSRAEQIMRRARPRAASGNAQID